MRQILTPTTPCLKTWQALFLMDAVTWLTAMGIVPHNMPAYSSDTEMENE